MVTHIDADTVAFVRESLKKHGFEHALQRCSVDCVAAGMDADDFTYQVVSLFLAFILAKSMESHSDPQKKFEFLQANTKAIAQINQRITLQLAKQLDQMKAAEDRLKSKVDVSKSVNPELH